MITIKRSRKIVSDSQLLPKGMRIVLILQLCFAFCVILNSLSYPFMKNLFDYKEKILLFHQVMGIPNSEENQKRFSTLQPSERHEIVQNYHRLQGKSNDSFATKTLQAVHILLFELPLFERGWIALSIAIAIALLLRVEGALLAVWLLPIITSFYIYQNYTYGDHARPSEEIQLFPTEQLIVSNYLKEPLSTNIETQREQLLHGWQRYLIQEWAHQDPSTDHQVLLTQYREGEFAFNLARLKIAIKQPDSAHSFNQREAPFKLFLYMLWNLLVPILVTLRLKQETSQ